MKKTKNHLLGILVSFFILVSCNSAEILPKSVESFLRQSMEECQLTGIFRCTLVASQKGTNPAAELESVTNVSVFGDSTYNEVWCIVLRNMDNNTFYRVLYYRNKPSIFAWFQPSDERLLHPLLTEDLAKVGCTQLPLLPESVSVTVNLSPLPTPITEITEAEAIELAKTYLAIERSKGEAILLGAESMTYLESLTRLDDIISRDLRQQDAETKVWVVGFKSKWEFDGRVEEKSVYCIMRASDGGHITNFWPLESTQVFSN